ncbi:hypothetical protein Hanom_Chr16g01486201 [Helianthus anomalus]
MEKLDGGSTVNYGATVIYGGADMVMVITYCCTVEEYEHRGHRNLRCHRKLRWRSFFKFLFFF